MNLLEILLYPMKNAILGMGFNWGNAFKFGGNKNDEDGGGGDVSAQPQIPVWQSAVGEDLSAWVRKFLKSYTPGEAYGGKLSVTDPSSFEQMGLGELGKLLGGPATGELYGAAKGQVMDTLGGRYSNPETSPFIQSFQKLAGQNLQDQITTARGQRGARGSYFTRAGLQEESRLTERTQNTLNSLIESFINQERGRQQAAVPQAQQLEEYGNLTAPLKRVAASQSFGSLPRLLEQSDLERKYSEFQRQRQELSTVPSIGTGVLSKSVPYGINQFSAPQQPGFFDQISPFIDVAAKILPFFMSGCWVASEIFGGFWNPKTTASRVYVNFLAPRWFKRFYLKYGERIAEFIRKNPVFKKALRPLFEKFSEKGEIFMNEGGR